MRLGGSGKSNAFATPSSNLAWDEILPFAAAGFARVVDGVVHERLFFTPLRHEHFHLWPAGW